MGTDVETSVESKPAAPKKPSARKGAGQPAPEGSAERKAQVLRGELKE